MKLSGWGRYPVIEAAPLVFRDMDALAGEIARNAPVIPFGNGRSYGDSALWRQYVPLRRRNRMISFDETTGLLTCEAGVLLSEIVETFLPRGWFLKVTPGTSLITVGGAIAADVHGKNHHADGCFGETVESFRLMLADGKKVCCSSNENQALFRATCGGMGLTGIILQAGFYLKRVHSKNIDQETIQTRDLGETLDMFEAYSAYPYSVAWVDSLASQGAMGRAVLTAGDFCRDGDLNYRPGKRPGIPFDLPSFALNRNGAKLFNQVYYARAGRAAMRRKVDVGQFFYPLDAVENWNRAYGRNGFVQYQFILPKQNSRAGLEQVLAATAGSGMGAFLAVLKLHGPANDNYLSFPLEGYSLALDFKVQPGLPGFLDELDRIVADHQGRLYLAKDARANRAMFEKGYPDIDRFRALRTGLKLDETFRSLQSERLGL